MKKTLCIVLTFALLFALAACTKNKGDKFVEPPTEIITFENGNTAIYEVVTDDKGVTVTGEDGQQEYKPYDPPVTNNGGYLVTDTQGSTIKQSATTQALTAIVENGIIDLDTTAATTKPGSTTGTTAKGETTTAQKPTTTLNNSTNMPTKPEPTTLRNPVYPEPQTKPLNGTLSKQDAATLVNILSIDNTFDEALCEPDYYKAEKELEIYIEHIKQAITKIKANKALYQFVGDENLQQWIDYMKAAQDDYAVFMGMVRGTEGMKDKPSTYYTAYETFQNSYRKALKVMNFMKISAEDIIYNS